MDSPKTGRSATATEATARASPKSPGPSTAHRSPFAFPNHGTVNLDEVDVRFRGGAHESVSLQPGGKVKYGRSVSDTADQFISHPLAATTGSDFYTSEHSITPSSSKKSTVRSNTTQISDRPSQKSSTLNGSSTSGRNGQPGLVRHSSGAIQSIQQPTVGLVPSRLASITSRAANSDGTSGKSGRPNYERMHSGRMSVYIPEEPDQIDALPFTRPYRKRDVLLTIWAIGTYLWDYVSDWVVAAGLYRDKDYIWFGLTTAFIVVPHLTMTMFSLAWYLQDRKNNPNAKNITVRQWFVRIIVLMLQLAPVLRYVDSLRYGYRFRYRAEHSLSRLDLYQSLCFENADAAMLRLFEAFMEAAPQLVLQIYIIVTKKINFEKFDFLETVQIISIFGSWFSLATAMATFHRAQRFSQPGKGSMSLMGTLMQFGWHLFVFASRVIAIALFTVHFRFWGPVACAVHVIVMIVWILTQHTDFCYNRWLEYLYDIAMGCLYLFAFINVKDTPTKWKYVFYYCLYYVENVVLVSLWYHHTQDETHWFRIPAMAAVIGGFWIGIIFMLIYYIFFHPDKGRWVRKRNHDPTVQSNRPKWLKSVLDFCL